MFKLMKFIVIILVIMENVYCGREMIALEIEKCLHCI